MKLLLRVLILAVCLLGLAAPASAAPARHALVIGNAAYPTGVLANPRNDADLMAGTLERLGFSVTRAVDLGRRQLFDEVSAFAQKLPSGAMAVVYYAGHGMQVQGANYLIPIDMVPTSEQGVAMRAYPVSVLLDKLAVIAGAVTVVILDACRNNPFLPQRESRYRSFDGLGLAKPASARGMLVAYSTAPGQLAEDGRGRRHSYYTEALAQAIVQPGKPIERLFKEVAEIVRRKTLDDQQPWFESSLVDDYYFLPPGRPLRKREPHAIVFEEAEEPQWYMKLSEQEWEGIDAEVQERARRLSPDALPLLVHRARGGNVIAQTTLALARIGEGEQGTGAVNPPHLDKNEGQAIDWLRQAAAAGFPMAEATLGEMYYEGRERTRDLAEAERWFERAARADYARARRGLAAVKTTAGRRP